jgi:hypothetical protein
MNEKWNYEVIKTGTGKKAKETIVITQNTGMCQRRYDLSNQNDVFGLLLEINRMQKDVDEIRFFTDFIRRKLGFENDGR